MKMKKVIAFVSAVVLAAGAMTGLVGCGKKQGVVQEDTVINVRVLRLGFGDEHITALIEAFEKTYEEEGYKVNVVSTDSNTYGSTVTNEMILGENNGIDLYFTEEITPYLLVNTSKQSNIDMIGADLSDVYTSKPIGTDKKEEDVTVQDKLRKEYMTYFTYTGEEEEYNGKQYCYPLHTTPVGLIVNEELLNSYGLELPKTTNEMIHCYEVISEKSGSTGVYPNAWAGYNATSYWRYLIDAWVAQYSGVDAYNKFLSMEYSDDITEGWRVYEDQGWVESYKVLGVVMNPDYAPVKTLSMDHTTAQHQFLSGKAVFMSNGAWLENEMKANYGEDTWDIKMMKTPVVSALGVKLGLDGNGGKDAAKCDTVLSQIVGLIDEDKGTDEIITTVASSNGVNLNAEQVEGVRAARRIFYDKSAAETIVVNAYSKKLDVVKLFLRFIASDDACQIILDNSKVHAAFTSTKELNKTETTPFMESVNAISQTKDATPIMRQTTGLRVKMNVGFFNEHGVIEKTIAAARGKLDAKEIMQKELEYAKKIWPERLAAYEK